MRLIDESLLGRHGSSRDQLETLADGLAATTRYDVALALIPLAFAVALLGAYALGAGLLTAIVPSTLVALFVIVDVCYRNPPTEEPPS
ncbi:hypothetical protein [Natronobeatus ordinarius]|uniref:hypothetical protein n=1 Tax=Natronobeatus ordinarius TaxID=2963433 RepID=UPI0020CE714C|nr:hypothetical protein [Natronobeatus ordinarius]